MEGPPASGQHALRRQARDDDPPSTPSRRSLRLAFNRRLLGLCVPPVGRQHELRLGSNGFRSRVQGDQRSTRLALGGDPDRDVVMREDPAGVGPTRPGGAEPLDSRPPVSESLKVGEGKLFRSKSFSARRETASSIATALIDPSGSILRPARTVSVDPKIIREEDDLPEPACIAEPRAPRTSREPSARPGLITPSELAGQRTGSASALLNCFRTRQARYRPERPSPC